MAIVEQTAAPPKGPSLMGQMIGLLVATVAAVGLGWGAGMYMKSHDPAAAAAGAEAPAAGGHGEAAGGHGDKAGGHGEAAEGGDHGAPPANPLLIDLAPLTTNLAAPNQVWVRLEASIVLDQPQPPELPEAIHQDLLAYLRTIKLHQIEGASGYQHMKADMEERARIRSGGHVKQVLIRTLLLE